jgi:hypothetical protein
MSNGHPRPAAASQDALAGILKQVGIGKDSTILLTGPSGLLPLLWFCRHDYRHVGYVRPGPAPANDRDLLLVPHTCDIAALTRILEDGPHVRPGGVLIVATPEPKCGSGADPVHQLLRHFGFEIERCLHGAHRELHVARRRKVH